ncbi:MAG: DNA repair protein RecO [Ruminococcaceae bacterium]|nr:DNA repair protein RecO [Oscillospiraceae bacterium]
MKGTCDGLVIRVSDYGENDKLLTILTADKGKMLVTAKGARSVRSKMLSMSHLFVYANFEYYEKNGRKWLSGGSVSDSFYRINSDIVSFTLASYILQLAAEITGEGVPCEDVLRMTLNTLYAIEHKLKPTDIIKSAYEIFAAEVSGFSPNVLTCDECGCEESTSDWWLDVMNGRILCGACLTEKSRGAQIQPTDELMTRNILLPLDASALAAWRYVMSASPKRIFSFSLTGDSLDMFSRSTEEYIINHLERSFEALEFYHAVKE